MDNRDDVAGALTSPAAGDRIPVSVLRVGVVALGTIGRQELRLWRGGGFGMVGYDVNSSALQEITAQDSDGEGSVELVSTPDALQDCGVLLLCLPTADRDANVTLRAFDDFVAVRSTGSWLPSQLTIVASTVPIGFTRALAQRIGATHVAHAPERFDPGRSASLGAIPRVVGGLTDQARDAAIALYVRLGVSASPASSVEVAEASKLLENAFRLLNIAFVNEFAALCQRLGISTAEVIQAAASKPFGFMPHYPGPGAGGLCIPVVPQFLLDTAREQRVDFRTLDASIKANAAQPDLIGDRIDEILSGTAGRPRVLVVGATYKANYPDARGSMTLKLIRRLARKYETAVLDPWIRSTKLPKGVVRHDSTPEERFDLVVIAVRHSSVETEKVGELAPVVVDLTRGELRVAHDAIRPQAQGTPH
jgi:UDP-N-acetyl-D-glucosamine dehydrogenase